MSTIMSVSTFFTPSASNVDTHHDMSVTVVCVDVDNETESAVNQDTLLNAELDCDPLGLPLVEDDNHAAMSSQSTQNLEENDVCNIEVTDLHTSAVNLQHDGAQVDDVARNSHTISTSFPTSNRLPDPVVSNSNIVIPEYSHHNRGRRDRRRRRHVRRNLELKQSDSNFPSAAFSVIAIVLLCTAMAETHWFSLSGGSCQNYVTKQPLTSLSLSHFFYMGTFTWIQAGSMPTKTSTKNNDFPSTTVSTYLYWHNSKQLSQTTARTTTSTHHPGRRTWKAYVYIYGRGSRHKMLNCVTPKMVEVLKALIMLCCLGTSFSLIAFITDSIAPNHKAVHFLRKNAVFNVATVLTCLIIHSICYWFSQLLRHLQEETSTHPYDSVAIGFGAGFYLVTAAGISSVLAMATTLLRPLTMAAPHTDQHPLIHDTDNMDIGSQFAADGLMCGDRPPPYTP